jgi:NAD(P)H-dependent FMN reductase
MPSIPRAREFLALSGSLRLESGSTALLRAAALLVPPGIRLVPFNGLGGMPPFNPDLDRDPLPVAVGNLRARIAAADGVFICSPEYAHGIPGVLKNALDWLVGGIEILAKPVALLNPSPRAIHAQASLVEVLRTIGADLVPGGLVTVPLIGRNLDAASISAVPELAALIRGALSAMVAAVERRESALAAPSH